MLQGCYRVGPDEIFGGYPWYRDKQLLTRYGFPWAQSTAYRAGFLQPEFADAIDASRYVDERYQATLRESDILPGTNPEERRMKEMVNLNMRWFMQTLLDAGVPYGYTMSHFGGQRVNI